MTQLSMKEYLKRVAAGVGVGLLIITLAVLLWRTATILLYIFTGILLAVFLRTIAGFFERHLKLRSRWALTLTVLLLLAPLITTGWLIGSRLAVQTSQLVDLASFPRTRRGAFIPV